ncbi:MAG: GGDEF domain-containing protein [Burkholderiales bacterium]
MLFNIKELWSSTEFSEQPELSAYAEGHMVDETRKGLRAMAVVLMLLLSATAICGSWLGLGQNHAFTYGALAALALHVYFASGKMKMNKELHLLGMALLIICGAAIVLLAHQSSALGTALFGSAVLLFMVVPMVPWGLREASIVAILVYLVFTVSTLGKQGHFTAESLLTLQFFMIAACAISLSLVARGVRVRKHDIEARHRLEKQHIKMENLSYTDPLTGAWNRRYLSDHFQPIIAANREAGINTYFAVFDIDKFKGFNDNYGHGYGDLLLQCVSIEFNNIVRDGEIFVRLGGDEFAMLMHGELPQARLTDAISGMQRRALEQGPKLKSVPTMSVGFTRIQPEDRIAHDTAYKCADEAAYIAKKAGGNQIAELTPNLGEFIKTSVRRPG